MFDHGLGYVMKHVSPLNRVSAPPRRAGRSGPPEWLPAHLPLLTVPPDTVLSVSRRQFVKGLCRCGLAFLSVNPVENGFREMFLIHFNPHFANVFFYQAVKPPSTTSSVPVT